METAANYSVIFIIKFIIKDTASNEREQTSALSVVSSWTRMRINVNTAFTQRDDSRVFMIIAGESGVFGAWSGSEHTAVSSGHGVCVWPRRVTVRPQTHTLHVYWGQITDFCFSRNAVTLSVVRTDWHESFSIIFKYFFNHE